MILVPADTAGVSALRSLTVYGYDHALSIEHEDSLLSPDEGLSKAAAFLNAIVIRDRPTAAWWV